MSKSKQSPKLTPRQVQLLKILGLAQARKGYSATIGELASQLKLGRTTTFEHLEQLREKGLIESEANKARSLKLTLSGQKLLNQLWNSPKNIADDTITADAGIPLLGRIAAGKPIEAIENRQTLDLPGCFPAKNVFALEVVGQSMIDAGINHGDYVICKKTDTADNGSLVVALVDNNTATLKRLYKEPTCVRLEPANPAYEPIYTTNCLIQGIVVGLVRKI